MLKNLGLTLISMMLVLVSCFLSTSSILVSFLFKVFKFFLKPKSLLFFFIYFVMTYIMCPYMSRITMEGAFYSVNYILNFFVFSDNKMNFLAFLNLLQSCIWKFFVGIKFALYMMYKNAWSHLMLLNNAFSNYLVQPFFDFLNYIFNFFLMIFFKQFMLLGNILSHMVVKNFSCIGKYYLMFVFMMLMFILVELYKKFFLKKN